MQISMTPSGTCPMVLLILDSLVPGGAERSTVALLGPLAARGFDLEVAMLHNRPGLQDAVTSAGFPLHDLSGPGGRTGWIRRIRALLSDRTPDLVHTSLFEADVCGRTAAFTKGVPVVSSLATEHYGSAHLSANHLNQAKVRGAQVIDATTARMTRRLHAVSTHVADTMAQHLRYPRDRIDVVYRGRPAELARVRPESERAEARVSLSIDDRLVVLALARHEPAKGIDRLIDAFPAVVDAHPTAVLLVAGRLGLHTPELKALVERHQMQGSVRFLGHRCDVEALLAASDVFVLPSRREGLPGSLLEAMALGAPAVVNDLPQIREVADSGEAVIVDASHPGALAAGIVSVLSDQAEAAQRADRARNRFLATFTLDQAADGMAEFYRRSLA
jgi:glycosyltransferase involved in cell wall biosynthesis